MLQNKKLQINPIFSQKNILLHISQTPFLSFFCLSPKQNTQPLRHSDKDRRLMTFFLFFSPFFYFPPLPPSPPLPVKAATLYRSLGGVGSLHKRGYRVHMHAAALRVFSAGYHFSDIFIRPNFCSQNM